MFILTIPLLLTCLSITQGLHLPSVDANLKHKIENYLTEWSQSLDGNNIRTPECLAAFMAQVSALSEQFERSYASCLQIAEDARAAVDAELQAQRTQLQSDAASTCSLYSDCDEQTNALDFFSCYSDSSNQAAKLSQAIGVSANQAVHSTNFKYESILYEQTLCTSEASQVYSQGFNQANADLNDCLAGKPVTTTSTSTSTSTSTTTSTSAAPATSASTSASTSPSESTSPETSSATPPTTEPVDATTVERSPEEDLDIARKKFFKFSYFKHKCFQML